VYADTTRHENCHRHHTHDCPEFNPMMREQNAPLVKRNGLTFRNLLAKA
jgi:hypothetical protein